MLELCRYDADASTHLSQNLQLASADRRVKVADIHYVLGVLEKVVEGAKDKKDHGTE